MTVDDVGAACFGLVIGWVTYRSLRHRKDRPVLRDISVVIGAVGGGAVVALFQATLFAWYAIGLALGFFLYLVVAAAVLKDGATWMAPSTPLRVAVDALGPAVGAVGCGAVAALLGMALFTWYAIALAVVLAGLVLGLGLRRAGARPRRTGGG
ncbi:hypothetical protein ACF1A5_09060 [Streptomyces sp. NPDC014864]|uniref:hypothetical protein n=1 Tax=Streptomyces sp. NPDC014864 TaxID=3364924 RepID=UPI0036F81113